MSAASVRMAKVQRGSPLQSEVRLRLVLDEHAQQSILESLYSDSLGESS